MRYIRRIIIGLFVVTLIGWGASTFIFQKNVDKEPPVITADTDSIKVSVKDGEEALKQGLKAEDNKDGDLTKDIILGKQTKFVNKGMTKVQYLVFDSSNNVGSFTRNVEYTDYTSPVFTLSKPLVYGVGENVTVLDRLSAVDSIEGDISDKIKIVSSDVNRSEAGVYLMGIQVSNRFGDVVTAELPVNIISAGSSVPFLALDNYLVTINKGEAFNAGSYLEGVKLTDGSSVNKANVGISGSVDTSTPGTYQIIYSYQGGQTSLTVVVRE